MIEVGDIVQVKPKNFLKRAIHNCKARIVKIDRDLISALMLEGKFKGETIGFFASCDLRIISKIKEKVKFS